MTDTRAFNSADLHPLEGWGGGPEISHFEGVMWRLDANPHMRSTMTGVEILDHAPDWQRLRAAHERLTASIPRFRQCVVEPLFGLARRTGWMTRTFHSTTTCAACACRNRPRRVSCWNRRSGSR